MALEVHNFTDLVNLQTVCKSTDLQVFKSIDSPCQNMNFIFAFGIPGKIAACTKHNCGRNMVKIILLKNLFEFIVFVSSIRSKKLPEIFLFRFVPLACLAESTHMYATLSDYIVYSEREKTCTA